MDIVKSFKYALTGILHVLKSERNARIHLLLAVAAMGLGLALKISPAELAAIFFAIIIVFLAELTNTALEKTLDLIEPAYNGKVAVIKDMAAGAVLIAAAGALIIGGVIFWPYVIEYLWMLNG